MRAPPALLALAAACLSACGDPSAPTTNLHLSVVTTGVDDDPDGYLVFIGGAVKRVARPTARFELSLEPGTYELRISDLATNCSVQGPATARVTITQEAPAEAGFRVECRAVAGVIEVSAPTSGRDYPLNGHSVAISAPSGASWLIAAPANGAILVTDLAPGEYELRIAPIEGNCSLIGEDTRRATVTVGGLTRETARAQWGIPVYLSKNASRLFERVAPGDHALALGHLPRNCSVSGPHPRTVSVTAGAVSEASLSVACGAP